MREAIDPKFIDKIEVSEQPSLNYQNGFRNFYKDVLEQTVVEFNGKKQNQKMIAKGGYPKCSTENSQVMTNSQILNTNLYSPYLKKTTNFVEHDEQKRKRQEGLIYGNYGG